VVEAGVNVKIINFDSVKKWQLSWKTMVLSKFFATSHHRCSCDDWFGKVWQQHRFYISLLHKSVYKHIGRYIYAFVLNNATGNILEHFFRHTRPAVVW
jgi:hypothetical protein